MKRTIGCSSGRGCRILVSSPQELRAVACGASLRRDSLLSTRLVVSPLLRRFARTRRALPTRRRAQGVVGSLPVPVLRRPVGVHRCMIPTAFGRPSLWRHTLPSTISSRFVSTVSPFLSHLSDSCFEYVCLQQDYIHPYARVKVSVVD